MYLNRRKSTRPLGHVMPESKIEIHIEKALFRSNVKLLGDLINVKRRKMPLASSENVEGNEMGKRYKLINNANHAIYHNPISEKVVGDHTRKYGPGVQTYQSLMCDRKYQTADGNICLAPCDVLGPNFCIECMKLRKRNQSFQKHQWYFPDIQVHPKYLVAPVNSTKLLLEQKNLSPRDPMSLADMSNNGIANMYRENDGQGMDVYTEHEICKRMKHSPRKNQITASLINKDDEIDEEKLTGPPNSRKNSCSDFSKTQSNLSAVPNDIRVTFSFTA